jgi:hypothetical protein
MQASRGLPQGSEYCTVITPKRTHQNQHHITAQAKKARGLTIFQMRSQPHGCGCAPHHLFYFNLLRRLEENLEPLSAERRSMHACLPACLPYLTCTYLGTRNPALATRLNRSCAAGSTVYANALEHFNPLPSSQAMSARPDGTVPTGGKWKKKQKQKKKKMNSVRKTASAENLLCPRTQPTNRGRPST